MKKPRFKIGEWVETNTIVTFGYKGDKRVPIKFKRNVIGQIVGATYRHTGEYSHGIKHGGYMEGYDYEQASLVGGDRVLVWQIKIGYLNKPVEALEEDIRVLESYSMIRIVDKLPWMHTRNKWPQWAKDKLSEESKSWPRDEKGRWEG